MSDPNSQDSQVQAFLAGGYILLMYVCYYTAWSSVFRDYVVTVLLSR